MQDTTEENFVVLSTRFYHIGAIITRRFRKNIEGMEPSIFFLNRLTKTEVVWLKDMYDVTA